jgi:outer membrane protein assembly factor BamB
MNRRRILAALGSAISLSGCLRLSGGDATSTSTRTATSRQQTTRAPTTRTATPQSTDSLTDSPTESPTESPTDSPTPKQTVTPTSSPSTTKWRTISVSDNWRQFQQDNGNTGHHTRTSGPTTDVKRAWRFSTRVSEELEARNFNPVVSNNRVFFSSQDDYIYSLNASTGEKLWEFTAEPNTDVSDPRRKCTPTVVDGTVYAEGSAGFLYALDAKTGDLQWRLPQSLKNGHSTPIVSGDTIYTGRGIVAALNRFTGALKWSRRIAGSTLALGGDTLFISGGEPTLFALDRNTGETRWTFDGPTSHPAYSDGTVYVGTGRAVDDTSPSLYAIDAEKGTEQWSRSLPGEIGAVSSPTVGNGIVLIGNKSTRALHAYSTEDGSEQWRYKMFGHVFQPPAIVDGHVYLGGWSEKIHCIRATDGQRKWAFALSSTVNSPTVVDGNILVATRNGEVWALTGV